MFGEIQIAHYRHVMASTIATEVADLFKDNYPVVVPEDRRLEDIDERCDSKAIIALLGEGIGYYIARQFGGGALAGFIENRIIETDEVVYDQMTWIMVNRQFRGTGVATALNDKFLAVASLRAEDRVKPTFAQLSVHKDNVDAHEVYAHWGYRDIGETQDGQSIFMVKDLT
jgi:ribosomal protein S18 acetylase RimI-like enzyme